MDYVYDTFDRLVGRAESQGATPDPNAVWTHYLYADGQPYADAKPDGTVTQRYLFGLDGAPLARLMDGAAAPEFYLTDRQHSVLQIVDAAGTALKRVWYSGLSVPAAKRVGPAASDRFELGGQTHDQAAGLSMLGGSWFHPGTGRHLTENNRGVGLNPYPVAQNNAPNELKSGYVGSVDTGLNWLERTLGGAWQAGERILGAYDGGRNVVSGVSFAVRQGPTSSEPG